MSVFKQAVPGEPTMPSDDVVKLRARLVAEETCEFLRSLFHGTHVSDLIAYAFDRIDYAIEYGTVNVDMVEMVDATIDLDYVVEGTRLAFGINGAPLWDEVHRANMAKVGGPVVNGKQLKPEDWEAPDIYGLLRAQGWNPNGS
jgi:predicted HAD superfamily Cof-like phosphohydrolase